MKIPLKTPQEIKIMQAGGQRLAKVLKLVLQSVQPGESLIKLDKLAEDLIKKEGGQPSFKRVKNYHWATCLNINEGVVHGIPDNYQIKDGDILSVDVGIFYKGFHTDMAWTVEVRSRKYEVESTKCEVGRQKFLKVGEKALEKAIEAVKPWNRVGHISLAIEKVIKNAGYNPIKSLTGHGVGRKLHEQPVIPCFLQGTIGETVKLSPGMVLAIEVIYSQGSPEMVLKEDGWGISTVDGKLAALFEKTIAITKKGVSILTPLN